MPKLRAPLTEWGFLLKITEIGNANQNIVSCNDCETQWVNSCPYCKCSAVPKIHIIKVELPKITRCLIAIKQKRVSNKLKKNSKILRNIKPIDSVNSISVFNSIIVGKFDVCFYCDSRGNTLDHFYPKSKGGELLVPCCYSCNQLKGSLHPIEWTSYIENVLTPKDEKYIVAKNNIKTLLDKITNLP